MPKTTEPAAGDDRTPSTPPDTNNPPEAAATATPDSNALQMVKGDHTVTVGTARERVQLLAEGWTVKNTTKQV